MKNGIKIFRLLSLISLMIVGLGMNSQAHIGDTPIDSMISEVNIGGAYALFANKLGGEIAQNQLGQYEVLEVAGCAKGSKIFQFTLYITRNGKTQKFPRVLVACGRGVGSAKHSLLRRSTARSGCP